MTGSLVKGWCPGALRPMESGDGLIVRLKITGGIVPLDLAAKIAVWSARWGNGQIDLTSRTNLQIRGVTQVVIAPLQDAMGAAGLLDISPEGEAVRNVIASPLAGIDPNALLDIRPIVAALEARLATDKRLHGLPAKFCWLVDDGGSMPLHDIRADVRFEALSADRFAVGLDGSHEPFGPISIDEMPDIAARIAVAFMLSGARRMRDVYCADNIAEASGLKALSRPAEGGAQRRVRGLDGGNPKPPHPPIAGAMGPSLSHFAGEGLFVCVGLPFGRIAANDLRSLVASANQGGASELRLTPWRTIVISLLTHDSMQSLADALPSDSFILAPDDPRLRVAACVGAPACPRATTDVRVDALQLAAMVQPGTLLHVSGCAKGCAHPRPAALTLVAREGFYDLIRDGAPWDMPERTGLSPADMARGLTKGKAA
jgi:precorrin-3B synthase